MNCARAIEFWRARLFSSFANLRSPGDGQEAVFYRLEVPSRSRLMALMR